MVLLNMWLVESMTLAMTVGTVLGTRTCSAVL